MLATWEIMSYSEARGQPKAETEIRYLPSTPPPTLTPSTAEFSKAGSRENRDAGEGGLEGQRFWSLSLVLKAGWVWDS